MEQQNTSKMTMATSGTSEDETGISNINFHERIGQGGFGAVKRITFKKPYKGFTEAAAKSVVFDLDDWEVNIMTQLQHPHIVTLLGIIKTGTADVILMEYARNGSLHDYLKDTFKPLSYDLQKKWATESARAIQYLHQQNYLQRDIKPHNCLLFEEHVLKLCDFGLAREIEESQTTSSQRGTYRYMAPEIHVGNERGRAIYSKSSDIWAYGMLLLEICTRKSPFEEFEWHKVVFEVGSGTKPTIPEDCPKDMSEIMTQCWTTDPKQRITIEEVLNALMSTEISIEHENRSIPVTCFASCPDGDMVVVSFSVRHGNIIYLCSGNGKSKSVLVSPERKRDRIGSLCVCVSPLGYIMALNGKGCVEAFNVKGEYLYHFTSWKNDHHGVTQARCTIDRQGDLLVCRLTRLGCMINVHRCSDSELIRKIEYRQMPFETIQGITVNSKNQILIHCRPTDSVYSKVLAIDYSGKEAFSFKPGEAGTHLDTPVWPGGIVCDENDNIFVVIKAASQINTGRVHAYSPTGKFLQCMAMGLQDPSDLSITSDGKLLIANWTSVIIMKPILPSS